jgi:hypothetical protein
MCFWCFWCISLPGLCFSRFILIFSCVFGVFDFGLKKELILYRERKTNNRTIIQIG